jgi:prephenate dehydratase
MVTITVSLMSFGALLCRYLKFRTDERLDPFFSGQSQAKQAALAFEIDVKIKELASLEAFARHEVNLLKIESRPIHGRPWEYQFFPDVESDRPGRLERALDEVRKATTEVRVLGLYPAAKII